MLSLSFTYGPADVTLRRTFDHRGGIIYESMIPKADNPLSAHAPKPRIPFWLTAANQYNPVVPLSIFLRPSQRQCSGCDLLGRYRVQKRKTLPF